ncbi:MAG: hypothetical protein EBU26_18855 [Verrucomicrobia bacterium]|nr:hypothetical protein [Verrucomicrobiota bacterium]
MKRLELHRPLLNQQAPQAFLAQQWDFAQCFCQPELEEMQGVATGFGVAPLDLFTFLHLSLLKHLLMPTAAGDGCSVCAVATPNEGAILAKNRDFHGEHVDLQRIFLHTDPAWPEGRRFLCVGSLGAPGVYSSGINSNGLAVADTQIATTDHGVGWLRYFLMTRLLSKHATVSEALSDLKALPHAGGGSLVLADATGTTVAVDLGHRVIKIERASCGVSRTNHFKPDSVANSPDAAPMVASSEGRARALDQYLHSASPTLPKLQALMASHNQGTTTGLCRHGEDGDAQTLSGVVYICRERRLSFCAGNPCQVPWASFTLHDNH